MQRQSVSETGVKIGLIKERQDTCANNQGDLGEVTENNKV